MLFDRYIAYTEGYAFQLQEDFKIQLAIKPPVQAKTDYLQLDTNGVLLVKKGYAWDGPSGPTPAAPEIMRGSLLHDALYQLMRLRLIPVACREQADTMLRQICLEDGMSSLEAWIVYHAVRLFGGSCADPAKEKPVIYAPKVTVPTVAV